MFDEYNNLNTQLNKLVGDYTQGSDARSNDLKKQYGYFDAINNLDNIRKSVANTDQMLTDLPQNLRQRSAGRLITNAQFSRIKAAEQDPLVQQLTNLNRGLDVGQQGVNDIRSIIQDELSRYDNNFKTTYGNLDTQRNLAFNRALGESQNQTNLAAARLAADQAAKQAQDILDWQKAQADKNNQGSTYADLMKRINSVKDKVNGVTINTNPNSGGVDLNTPETQQAFVPGVAGALGNLTAFPAITSLFKQLNGGKSPSITTPTQTKNLINSVGKGNILADPLLRLGDVANMFLGGALGGGSNLLPGYYNY